MRECNLCRKLFSSPGGRVCQDCFKYLERIYPTVRSFIRDSKNPRLEVSEIADALKIPVKYVQGLVDYGYLSRDLPRAKPGGYGDEEKARLAQELQKATTDMKSEIAAARQTVVTYGQERYRRKK